MNSYKFFLSSSYAISSLCRGKINKQFLLLILFIPLLLSGCGSSGEALVSAIKRGMTFDRSKVWIEKVSFRADPQMNDQSPVTVHLVIAYTPELLSEIVKMDSYKYFEKVDQLKVDNNGKIDVFSFDILVGQTLLDQPITMSKMSGEGAVIFARYSSPGPHRALLNEESSVVVELGKDDLRIIQQKVD